MTGAVWALALAATTLGLGGLGIVFGIVAGLAASTNAGKGLLVPMIVLGSATVFGIVAMLVRLVSRLISEAGTEKEERRALRFSRAASPAEYNQPRIAPPPRVIGSVTEQTTRNFDPSVVDQPQR